VITYFQGVITPRALRARVTPPRLILAIYNFNGAANTARCDCGMISRQRVLFLLFLFFSAPGAVIVIVKPLKRYFFRSRLSGDGGGAGKNQRALTALRITSERQVKTRVKRYFT